MRKSLSLALGLLSLSFCFGQLPYTSKKFGNYKVSNILYGQDTAFDGSLTDLYLDIYKPVNDSNCKRPVLVMIHGGAWLGGDKAGGSLPALCSEFANRGYVVASINYRMGMHPSSYYVPYALCIQEKCSYVADSAEWYRAMYRAMQDAKSAVRFMKNRALSDSLDPDNVFLCGESAGAFTAMAAGWMDQVSEKSVHCRVIADAPLPDSDLASCVFSGASRKRPDLGSIDGKGNTGIHDSKVRGVAAFYGGVLDTGIFRQSNPTDTPVLYNYHATCDVIVDHNKGRIFWKLYHHCFNPVNLCMPFTSGPMSWGSTAIKSHLDSMHGLKPRYLYKLNSSGGSFSCDPNSNCHGIDNIAIRCNEIAEFFAPVIGASGNNPSTNKCLSGAESIASAPEFSIFPNPSNKIVNIRFSAPQQASTYTCILEGMDGKQSLLDIISESPLQIKAKVPEHLASGMYVLHLLSRNYYVTGKALVVKE